MDENLEMMLALQADDDFQKILQNDEILNQLENEKFSEKEEFTELMSVFSGKISINDIEFNMLTLGMWCYLYSIKNAIVCGEKVEKRDVDIFLYLLHEGYDGVSENIFSEAENFCVNNGIDYTSAEIAIYQLIKIAFRPLEMIPSRIPSENKPHFNLEWMTGILSTVCRMTNCTRQFALYKMSLSESFYYFIHKLKENDYKNQIFRRNSGQIDAEIYKRTFELGKKYYYEKYKGIK